MITEYNIILFRIFHRSINIYYEVFCWMQRTNTIVAYLDENTTGCRSSKKYKHIYKEKSERKAERAKFIIDELIISTLKNSILKYGCELA